MPTVSYTKKWVPVIFFYSLKSLTKGVESGVGFGSISQRLRGMDPRIRISTKMSRVPNTAEMKKKLALQKWRKISSQKYGFGIQDPEKLFSGSRIQGSKKHRITTKYGTGRCLPVPALNFGATRPPAAAGAATTGSSLGQNTLAPLRPASALLLPESRRGGGDGVRSGAARFLAGVAAALIPLGSVGDPWHFGAPGSGSDSFLQWL